MRKEFPRYGLKSILQNHLFSAEYYNKSLKYVALVLGSGKEVVIEEWKMVTVL